ncbi:MAG TPA: GntR family transcriptional regulator, partial [Burkholderiales bacterium]|nr:GntR family transcriptional regulator [Burkholderiales bacterium]
MLETAPLYHQLADQIHALIRAGTLRAGDRVPSVRRLSNQQRVSVSTVLQAYQRLEDIGVIEARPQSGYYVRRPTAAMQEPEPSKPPRRALNVEVNALADAVLAHAADPGVVAFGSACAAPELFQLERVRRVLSSVARRDRGALGRYGLPPGTERLRRAVA